MSQPTTAPKCTDCGSQLPSMPAGLRRPGRSEYLPCALCAANQARRARILLACAPGSDEPEEADIA